MAAVAASSDHAVEMMQNLSLDSQNNPHQVNDHSNKNAPVQYASFVNGAQSNGSGMPFDRSHTPFPQDFIDPNSYAYPSSTYFYGAFNGSSVSDWDRYPNLNGVDMPSAVYNDYQNGYGYAPYGPYSSSGAPLGHDSQLYLPQQYQYPTPYFQPSAVNSSQYMPNHSTASRSDVAFILCMEYRDSSYFGLTGFALPYNNQTVRHYYPFQFQHHYACFAEIEAQQNPDEQGKADKPLSFQFNG